MRFERFDGFPAGATANSCSPTQDRLPEFDVRHARYVLSVGADFLMTWLSPVHYGRKYGIFRQGEGPEIRPRGYLVQVEPRFSGTAANADEWLPVTPGREGLLALSLAQVIVSEGLGDPAISAAIGSLESFRPEQVERQSGVPADRIRRVARDFARQRPSVALAGGSAGAHSNGSETVAASS